jgi:hypothetical protein
MKELAENTIFVGVCVMLLCIAVLTGCEGDGPDGSSSDVNYTDAAAGSFEADTNGVTAGYDTTVPTNTIQPFSKEDFKDLSKSMTSNYASYFE